MSRSEKLPMQSKLWYVFVTALEGGIGYWSECQTYKPWGDKSKPRVPQIYEDPNDDSPPHEGWYAKVLDHVELYEGEGKRNVYRIDAKVIRRGLKRMLDAEWTEGGYMAKYGDDKGNLRSMNDYCRTLAHGILKCEDHDFDAGDADNIVQAGLFGDIRYS